MDVKLQTVPYDIMDVSARDFDEDFYKFRLEVKSPLERQPGMFEIAEPEIARADTQAHARVRAGVHSQGPLVPLQGVRDLIPLEEQKRLPEHRAYVVLAPILQAARLVQQLLRVDRVPLRKL